MKNYRDIVADEKYGSQDDRVPVPPTDKITEHWRELGNEITTQTGDDATNMRQAILRAVRDSGHQPTPELWFQLVFRTPQELRAICHALRINTTTKDTQ